MFDGTVITTTYSADKEVTTLPDGTTETLITKGKRAGTLIVVDATTGKKTVYDAEGNVKEKKECKPKA